MDDPERLVKSSFGVVSEQAISLLSLRPLLHLTAVCLSSETWHGSFLFLTAEQTANASCDLWV